MRVSQNIPLISIDLMETNKHYIKKQIIELGCHSRAVVEEPWAAISDLHKGRGLQVMSEVFDLVAPPGTYIKLDKLEIDLGVLSSGNFSQHYVRQLRLVLEEKLKGAVGAYSTNMLHADTDSVWESNILHYLRHGSFLWETAVLNLLVEKSDGLGIIQVLQKKILERMEHGAGFRHTVQRLLLQEALVMKRWVRQFSAEFLETVRQIFIKETPSFLQSLKKNSVQLVENYFHKDKAGERLQQESCLLAIWSIISSNDEESIVQHIEVWMQSVSLHVSYPEQESVLNIIKSGTTEDRNNLLVFLRKRADVIGSGSNAKIVLPEWIQQFNPGSDNEMPAAEKSAALPVPGQDGNGSGSSSTTGSELIKQDHLDSANPITIKGAKRESDQKKGTDNLEEFIPAGADEMYIENAGLVLLSPFITQYFTEAGLDVNANLSDQDASAGIYLLQLLVDQDARMEEPQLVLNKLLCGRPPAWPPFPPSPFSSQNQESCLQLLDSAVRHWSALKGTSRQGLRQTFLQREGKLYRKQGQWHLKIEYKTVDILLQSIPWTFSIVKLPWMPHPLYVEW